MPSFLLTIDVSSKLVSLQNKVSLIIICHWLQVISIILISGRYIQKPIWHLYLYVSSAFQLNMYFPPKLASLVALFVQAITKLENHPWKQPLPLFTNLIHHPDDWFSFWMKSQICSLLSVSASATLIQIAICHRFRTHFPSSIMPMLSSSFLNCSHPRVLL